jgi:hypothetical protein
MPISTDHSPEPRPTHAEKDSKGEWLGMEGRLALYPIVSIFGGILMFSVMYSFRHVPFLPAAPLCMVPGVIVTAIVVTLVNKKPPGYLRDWVDTQLGNASVEFRRSSSRHPLVDE